VRVAGCLARTRYTELHVVHVVANPAPEPVPERREVADAARALERLTASHESSLRRLVRRVLVGSPAEEIARYAMEQHAHLIVMGTHGYGPVRRLFLGSVTASVLHRARCAVLTVPPRERPSAGPALAAAEVLPSGDERSRGF
jgi:nucleotide-binding universal stress UspA family protein